MKLVLAIAAGGAVGALARHFAAAGITALAGPGFPLGIFVVNVVGSLMMGILVEAFALGTLMGQELRAFLAVGVLGAFTTFSTFSLDAVLLLQRGLVFQAMSYVGGSVVLAIAGLYLGLMLGRALFAGG